MAEPLGLSPPQLLEIKKILRATTDKKQSARVFYFGSRSRGDFRPYSDLDLWIESTPPLAPEDFGVLREKFEDSDLPIKIDLVSPDTVLAEYVPAIEKELQFWF